MNENFSPARRQFLKSGVAAVATLANAESVFATAPAIPTIDTHTHFYDPQRPQGVPWPGKHDTTLYRTVLPPEFEALTKPFGIVGTVAVEASPWLEDNQWLLDLAEKHKSIVAVVGNLSPGEENFEKHLNRFAANPLFRGFRVSGQKLQQGVQSPAFLEDLKIVAEHDLVLDLNGGPELLTSAVRIRKAVPNLKLVINHLANPAIDGREPPQTWRDGMEAASQVERAWIKVSAVIEKPAKVGGKVPAELDFYRPILDFTWRCWGENRVLFGSNWPVSDKAATYKDVQGITIPYFREKGLAALSKFCFENAFAAYRWPTRK